MPESMGVLRATFRKPKRWRRLIRGEFRNVRECLTRKGDEYQFYSDSKHNKKVAEGLIAAAVAELAKLRSDPPGPGGPGDHHRKEIKPF